MMAGEFDDCLPLPAVDHLCQLAEGVTVFPGDIRAVLAGRRPHQHGTDDLLPDCALESPQQLHYKLSCMNRARPIILLNRTKVLLQTFREGYRDAYNLLV